MAVEYKDYYKILGVDRKADKETISKAYKKLARKYHPDLNQGDSSAEEKFKEINEAHEVLKDDEKRRMYDQLGPDWQNAFQGQGGPNFGRGSFSFNGKDFAGSDFSDFFDLLFGAGGMGGPSGGRPGGRARGGFGADPFAGFSSRPRKGRDVEAEISLSLEDAVRGGERSLTLQGPDHPRTLKVNIPAGVRDGAKLRLAGQGNPGPSGAADQNGDLYLKVRFAPHPHFQVEGQDIIYDLRLPPWQAALGTKARIPTLEGEVEMAIPAGTSSGRKLRLRGKGLGAGAKRGDEYVRVGIVMPEKLTSRQRELWEALAAEEK